MGAAAMLEEIDLKLRDLLDIASKPMTLGAEADKLGTGTMGKKTIFSTLSVKLVN
jgi:hypothetical protein